MENVVLFMNLANVMALTPTFQLKVDGEDPAEPGTPSKGPIFLGNWKPLKPATRLP